MTKNTITVSTTTTTTTATSTAIRKNDDDTEEQVLDACIFNCTYAQQVVDDEEKGKKTKMDQGNAMEINRRMKNDDQKLDVVVSDSMSDGSISIDDRSLLDYDSSNSWNDGS